MKIIIGIIMIFILIVTLITISSDCNFYAGPCLGQAADADFGQSDFGQTDFWPNKLTDFGQP